MINHSVNPYREPAVYYAEASSYLDAMDYVEFMSSEGWKILVPPFVTQTETIYVEKLGQVQPTRVEHPVEWGFVLHKFHERNVL